MELANTPSPLPASSTPEPPESSVDRVEPLPPVLSVIIPVRNSPKELRECLKRLEGSTYSRYEVIVVDDASTDNTAQVAAEFKVQVLRLEKNLGPAGARNRGSELARGEILFFLDADVCAYPDTVGEVVKTFADAPDLTAVFGSYDTQPTAENVLSEYKNLFHHFVHQDSNERATTFWSGCGAVRRAVFQEMGGFSNRYGRPSIEDIELGQRLHKAGHRIMLNKRIQVTHLKRWTLWSIIKTDVLDRGVPWTELMLREGSMPNDLNVKHSQRISVMLSYALLIVLGVGVWYYRHLLWFPALAMMAIIVADYWSTNRRYPTLVRVLAAIGGLITLAIVGFTFKFWPLLPLALVVGIIAINFRFYAFFLRERHLLLLTLLIPLHLIYYLYCGLAFALGISSHFWKTRVPTVFTTKADGEKASSYTPA